MSERLKPYDVLGVSKTATEQEIAKAYRKLALQFHPDRNPEGADRFKTIGDAYSILSDPVKRGLYDNTGSLGDLDGGDGEDGSAFGTGASDPVAFGEAIDKFYETYVDSPEEKEDIVTAFEKTKGNFIKMVTDHLLFKNEPGCVQRLFKIVSALLAEGKVAETEKWTTSTTSQKLKALERRQKEEREAADILQAKMKKGSGHSGGAAMPLIDPKQRSKQWNSFLDDLAAKYGNAEDDVEYGPKKTKKKTKKANAVEAADDDEAPRRKKARR